MLRISQNNLQYFITLQIEEIYINKHYQTLYLQSEMIQNQVFSSKLKNSKIIKLKINKEVHNTNIQLCNQHKFLQSESSEPHFSIVGKSLKASKFSHLIPITKLQISRNSQNVVQSTTQSERDLKLAKVVNQKHQKRFRVVKKSTTSYPNLKEFKQNTILRELSKNKQNHYMNLEGGSQDQKNSNKKYFYQDPFELFQKNQISSQNSQQLQSNNAYLSNHPIQSSHFSQQESKNKIIDYSSSKDYHGATLNNITMASQPSEYLIQQKNLEANKNQLSMDYYQYRQKKQQQQSQFSNYLKNQEKKQQCASKYLPNQKQKYNKFEQFQKKEIINLDDFDQPQLVKLLNQFLKLKHLDAFCINISWFRRMKEIRLYQLKQFLYLHPIHKHIFPFIYRYQAILYSHQLHYIKYLNNRIQNQL